jgi:hypothetical protein
MNNGKLKLVTIHIYSYIVIQGHDVISHNSSNLSPFAVFIILFLPLFTPPVVLVYISQLTFIHSPLQFLIIDSSPCLPPCPEIILTVFTGKLTSSVSSLMTQRSVLWWLAFPLEEKVSLQERVCDLIRSILNHLCCMLSSTNSFTIPPLGGHPCSDFQCRNLPPDGYPSSSGRIFRSFKSRGRKDETGSCASCHVRLA